MNLKKIWFNKQDKKNGWYISDRLPKLTPEIIAIMTSVAESYYMLSSMDTGENPNIEEIADVEKLQDWLEHYNYASGLKKTRKNLLINR